MVSHSHCVAFACHLLHSQALALALAVADLSLTVRYNTCALGLALWPCVLLPSIMSSRNINGRESLLGGSLLQHHRRGHSFNGYSNSNSDENLLDLFSKNRRTLSVASSNESSDVSAKLGRLSVGSAKLVRSEIDDLLSSTEGGKHDYDWLLTPPETPVFPSSEGESQPTSGPPRRSLGRSTTNTSRLSVSQSENNNHSRPARSNSVTRSSNSSSNRSSSILNTSTASISSYTRPSSPITRSPSAASRPSTPSSRPTASRPSTPSRARSVPTSSCLSADKSRPSQSSRPSTPSSRPQSQIPANLHSPSVPSARPLSRPCTPTRRNSMPSPSSSPSPSPKTANSSNSVGRVSLISRPSSPGPRPPPQPVVPHDFPLETPPNLRTTLPDRPVSAGRSRPGAATLNLKPNSENQASTNMSRPRRQSSPIVNRGRLTEPTGKSRGHANANGHHADVPEPRRVSHAPEVAAWKYVKASTTVTVTDNSGSGFGRSISKKSLDMAIRHMDIRNSSGNLRSISSTTLFPQSIRTSTPKTQSNRGLSAPASVDMNGSLQSSNNGNDIYINRINGRERDKRQYFAKLSEVDIYESSDYEALLLKEDFKNTSWLHSADDKCDQGPFFDNGFEPLPEPFGLL